MFRIPPGLEGKYFYPTREQAENLASMFSKAGIGGPYKLTSGMAPRSVLEGVERIHPAGEGAAFFFRRPDVGAVRDVRIWGELH